MLGKIDEIIDNTVKIKLEIDITQQPNLVNLHVIFEDGTDKKIVAEVANVNKEFLYANVVGEINGDFFMPGASKKPSFKSTVRLIQEAELSLLLGERETISINAI